MSRRENTIGFVLLTHNKPHQVLRLVTRLNTMFGDPPIVIHHDFDKCALPETEFPDNVSFVHPHVETGWGDFSLVAATLRGLAQMYERADAPDWCVILSGDSYPTKPANQILENLTTGGFDAHIDAQQIGRQFQSVSHWHYEYYKRHCLAYFDIPSVDKRGRPRPRRILLPDALSERLAPFREGLRSFGGSQWFSLSRRAAGSLAEFQETPGAASLKKHYRKRPFADEAYFQTALCNAPGLTLNLANWMYLEWPEGSFHPKLLTLADLEALSASPTHFARKIDIDTDSDLLDALDRVIDGQQSAETRAGTATWKK